MALSHLAAVTHEPRTFGYMLASLLLATLVDPSAYVYGWMVLLLFLPPMLRWLLGRVAGYLSPLGIMAFDGIVVGLLVSLVGFNLEASVVLLSLLSISALIVGGIGILVTLLPIVLVASLAGVLLHPQQFIGDESFYFVSFACLLSYIVFVGLLVHKETERLNIERNAAWRELQALVIDRHWLASFVPKQLSESRSSAEQSLPPQRRRQLCVLFADIQGFTRLMDTVDESVVADFLNRYFSCMSEIADGAGATLDKFIGDGLMVFFGDPLTQGVRQDAESCVALALHMQQAFAMLSERTAREKSRAYGQADAFSGLALRVGIHAGYCLVGDFGCDARRNYTALGGTVNLASRLEAAALPGEILISDDTRQLVAGAVQVLPRGTRNLKGIRRPVKVFAAQAMSRDWQSESIRLLS